MQSSMFTRKMEHLLSVSQVQTYVINGEPAVFLDKRTSASSMICEVWSSPSAYIHQASCTIVPNFFPFLPLQFEAKFKSGPASTQNWLPCALSHKAILKYIQIYVTCWLLALYISLRSSTDPSFQIKMERRGSDLPPPSIEISSQVCEASVSY